MSASQISALVVGVLIGAVGTFVANELSDRAKTRRVDRAQWRDRRLGVYAEFVRATKATQVLLYRRGAALDNGPDLDPVTAEAAREQFIEQYNRRDEQFELMLLLAPKAVHDAARDWVFQLRELRRLADEDCHDPAEWARHSDLANRYRDAFHRAARADIGLQRL